MQKKVTLKYNEQIVKMFTIASLFWALFGLTAGVIIALQMAFPELNSDLPYFTFGRLRPVHTSGVIFAFGGNVLLGTSLYVVQRTSQARLACSNLMAQFVFWGYQSFLIMAVVGYMMGITQSREYAEAEWHADFVLLFVWIAYFCIYVNTLRNRKEPHIYVANWFYLSFILVVGVLHIGNNLSIPVSWTSSIFVFSGVQSAMIQWWYGHNAVGFFLTAGFIGIMYYFVPKRANRPVYSYRLSIMHFWAFVFLYIWAGAHHLHYTALPDWTQTLGMTMSVMLWLPSWGGMINGIMTLSGAWHKLREDPVLCFMVIALAFYGMSTFEGPVMAIKSVNALSHYTEWTISHVHSGALGWVAMISFGALYHLIPTLWKKDDMYSMKLVSVHLWLASIGIVLYITSMWAAGITQGLMWRSYDDMGFLKYSFIEIVANLHPYYVVRALGGGFFLLGVVIMVYNSFKTIYSINKNVAKSRFKGILDMIKDHKTIEKNVFLLIVLTFVVASIGTMTEILPLFIKDVAIEKVKGMRRNTPLELAGFEIYKSEGCYGCHSQQIRALRDEVERYGHYSLAAESMYDYPFQWGSKRTGPDLARVGDKYSDDWQVEHLINPQTLVPESIMPRYAFLTRPLDQSELRNKMEALRMVGVPYSDEDIEHMEKDIKAQLQMSSGKQLQSFTKRYNGDSNVLIRKFNKQNLDEVTEMDALVAYLQSLGNRVDLESNKGRVW